MFKTTLPIALCAILVASAEARELALEPIVISASKTEQSTKNVTSNFNVITAEELQEKHVSSVVDALNLISGVGFTSNGGLGQAASVYLRGFNSNRVLVLIDGIRYNDPTGLNGAPFENLMIADIARIEVIKGAQSGIWGADASAGVINIITKDAQKGVHGEVNGEYGSFNTKKYGASASYATDDYYLKVSSNTTDAKGFSAQAPKGVNLKTLEDDSYKNRTSSLKLGYKFNETNKMDVLHTIIDAKTEGDSWGNPDGKYDSTTKDRFTSVNFNHTDSFATTNIYAKESLFKREYPQDSYTRLFNGEVKEYGLQSKVSYLSDDFFVVGADYKNFKHLNEIDKEYNNKALFLTNSNVFNSKTVLTESIRRDVYDKFDNKTTYKIGIRQNFDGSLYFTSNYGTAYNIPTLYHLYSAYGNSGINPESTKSYDASIGYENLKLTYFYNTIENMIDFDMSSFTYNNINGTSTLKGFEIEYKNRVTQDIAISFNFTELSAKDKDGADLARRAKESLKFGADYYGVEKLHLGLFGEYLGSRYDDKAKTLQTGYYTTMNFVANYDFSKIVKIYGKIDNITDKQYQTTSGYASSPRAYYAGVRVLF